MNTIINKGQMNTVVLTLRELADPDLPELYLFRFTHEATNQSVLSQIPVASSNDRYDLFMILEGTDVTLPIAGDYRYEVFQVPNDTTLNPDDGIKVEEGKVEFNEVAVSIPSLTINYQAKVYEPGNTAS